MAQFISGRQRNLKVGISSFSENTTSLQVTGNVGIGTTFAGSSLYVIGDGRFTGVVTAVTFNGQINAGVATITTIAGTAATYSIGNITTLSGTYEYYNVGLVTALAGTALTYTTGNITTLSGSNLYYNTGIVTTLSGTYGYHNVGVVTALAGTALTYTTGNITTLSGTNSYYNVGVVTALAGTALTYTTGNITTLSGTYEYYNVGLVTAIAGTALTYTTGNITTLSGSNLYYNTGIVTTLSGTYGYHNVGVVTALAGTALTYTTGNITTLSGSNAYYNVGIITALAGTAVTYTTGNITTLSGTYAYQNVGIITALAGTALTYTTGNITTLSGSNAYYNAGILTSLTSTNLNVLGVSTLTTLSVGGTTGTSGQYLKSTGTGLVWSSFTSLRSVYNYTATEGQKQFVASGINTGYVDVFLNGIRLDDTNYSIIGTGVSLGVGAFGNDEITVVGFNTVNAGSGGSGSSSQTLDQTLAFGNTSSLGMSIGVITATNFVGNGSGLTGIVASGTGIIIRDDGSLIGTASTIDFGTNLSVSPVSAGVVTVTASGGSSSQWVTYSAGITTTSNVGIGTTNPPYALSVVNNSSTSTIGLANAIADFTSSVNLYSQINIRNALSGSNASSDVVVTADTGTDSTNFLDMGINNSGFSTTTWTINGATDGYLYTSNTNLSVGVATTGRYLSFFAGGTLISNEQMRVTTSGVGIGTTNPTTKLSIGGSFTATDTRIQSVAEKTTIVGLNTANLVYNTGGGNVAICTNPSGDITLNVTGIPTDSTFDNYSLTFSVIVTNTGTARSCTTVSLNGVSTTIKWFGGSLSAAISGVTTTTGYDIYNFTGINTVGSASTAANYIVFGSVNGGYR